MSGSAQSGKSCVWKLQFEAKRTKKVLSIYLSSNKRFISTSDFFSLKEDPESEQLLRNRQLMDALTSGDPPSKGASSARVTIVEFADFQCSYCARLSTTLQGIVSQDKSLRVVFRNFPLEKHTWAEEAAEMGECAAIQNQGAFWTIHDFFFSNQNDLASSDLYTRATESSGLFKDLDARRFKACVDERQARGKVDADIAVGRLNGVHVTPTFFVNGLRYEGDKDTTQLRSIIEAAERGDTTPVGAQNKLLLQTQSK